MFQSPLDFFQINGVLHPLAGRGLIIGSDDEGGSIAAESEIEDLDIGFVIPIQFPDSGHMEWLRVA